MANPSTAGNDPLIGHTVGRYRIESYVGDEQLGKVYTAAQLPAETPVSIKVLHPHMVEKAEVVARFGREMMATATINHPNSVQMLDFGDHRGVFHYIVLEHLTAHPLAEELQGALGKGIGVDRATHIAAQIASVLVAAHAENIVHRNLGPDNVLLLDNADGDYVKVRDFGLSRLAAGSDDGDSTLTAVGTRVGTIAYMAPEYIQANVVDPRGDLYSLGCLLFEMLTGRPPYVGKSGDVMEAHVTGEIPKASHYNPKVPAWLDALVTKLLAKAPFERPKDAGVVLAELQKGTGKRLEPPALTTVARRRTSQVEEEGGINLVRVVVGVGMGVLLIAVFGVLVSLVLLVLLAP